MIEIFSNVFTTENIKHISSQYSSLHVLVTYTISTQLGEKQINKI
jgi:hypothetical protein